MTTYTQGQEQGRAADGTAATLAFLVAHRLERLDPLTDRLVETIERDNAPYRLTGLVPRPDLRASCRENVDRVLQLLGAAVERGEAGTVGGHPDDAHAYDAARSTGRRRAEQGLPLDDVLRSFRIGGRLIWDDLVSEAAHLDATLLRDLGTHLWGVVDETSAQVAESYHRHERYLVRADEQQRAELWEGLLSGRGREPGFAAEVAGALDLPVTADLVVVVSGTLDPRRAERALSPHASSWVRRTTDVVGLVVLRDTAADVVAALGELTTGTAHRVGVSGPVSGLARADRGFAQAFLALRSLGADPTPTGGALRGGVAGFDDRLPEALLLSSPDVARRMVQRWLGPVLDRAPGEAEVLLDTLAAWVASGGSATRTAAVVPCHRNTVVNRVRRVSDLIGRPLDDDAVPIELDLALRAWRLR